MGFVIPVKSHPKATYENQKFKSDIDFNHVKELFGPGKHDNYWPVLSDSSLDTHSKLTKSRAITINSSNCKLLIE